jgi:hypothetical protein
LSGTRWTMIADWALIAVTIYGGYSVRETVRVFPTQPECFAALERDQVAHDRVPPKGGGLTGSPGR